MNAMSFTMDNTFSWTPDRTFLPLVFCTLVPLAGLIRNRTLQQNKDIAVKLGYNVQNLNKVGRHYGHKCDWYDQEVHNSNIWPAEMDKKIHSASLSAEHNFSARVEVEEEDECQVSWWLPA